VAFSVFGRFGYVDDDLYRTPYPMAMQMRYLQALAEVAADKNSTIIFPLPIELLAPFLKSGRDGASAAALTNGRPEDASWGRRSRPDPGMPLCPEQRLRRWENGR
jgi:hypothetical protein